MFQRFILVLMPLFLLFACTTVDTQVDYDDSVDFTALKTYSWLPEKKNRYKDQRLNSEIFLKRLHRTVNQAFTLRGFKLVSTNSDFTIGYHVGVKDRTSITTMNNYYGYPDQGWGRSYNPAYSSYGSRTTVYQYEEGSLTLDISKSKRLVWRGSAQAELMQSRSNQQKDELLEKAVNQMFEKFPPKK